MAHRCEHAGGVSQLRCGTRRSKAEAEGACGLTSRSTRTRSGIAPQAVRGSIRLAAQCHCVPVNSDVRPQHVAADSGEHFYAARKGFRVVFRCVRVLLARSRRKRAHPGTAKRSHTLISPRRGSSLRSRWTSGRCRSLAWIRGGLSRGGKLRLASYTQAPQ